MNLLGDMVCGVCLLREKCASIFAFFIKQRNGSILNEKSSISTEYVLNRKNPFLRV